jgi:Cof subfamily protein (haloacid dehalogenase superfamily)
LSSPPATGVSPLLSLRGGRQKSDWHSRADGGRALKWSVAIRLIATDIDGTLLDSQGALPAANAHALADAAAHGIEVVLVTGRRFHFSLPIAEQLKCELHLIVNNGALTKSRDGKTLARHLLPVETARIVLEATREFRDAASVMFDRPGDGQVILEKIDWSHPLRASYFRKNSMFLSEQTPLEACLNGEDPIQVGFTGNCAPLRRVQELLLGHAEAAKFAVSLTEYAGRDLSILDVLASGVTKGRSLAEWCALRGIAREDVMAVGDNFNDFEMLEFAGVPVIMGNAVDELKAKGYARTGSNDDNGLAEAIRKHALG